MTQSFKQDMLPRFHDILPSEIEPTIQQLLNQDRQKLSQLLAQKQAYTWDNLMQPLEDMSDDLTKVWGPITHMHNVMETEELRKAYNKPISIQLENGFKKLGKQK